MGNQQLRNSPVYEQSGRRQDTYTRLNFSLKISHGFVMVVKVIFVEPLMRCGVNRPDPLELVTQKN